MLVCAFCGQVRIMFVLHRYDPVSARVDLDIDRKPYDGSVLFFIRHFGNYSILHRNALAA